MYCPEKLKVNKFRNVRIPKPSLMFQRYGQGNPDAGSFSGDGDQTLPAYQSKIDAVAEVDAEYKDFLESPDPDKE